MNHYKYLVILFLLPSTALASTLTTENFVVSIIQNCSEGNVTCDDVSYYGISKNSGNSIKLRGTTWHTIGADGINPSRFLGYKFKNGNITYTVLESGRLEVVRGKSEILVNEEGIWTY